MNTDIYKNRIIEILLSNFDYPVCDMCENNNCKEACDECVCDNSYLSSNIGRTVNWELSESDAWNLAEEIIYELKNLYENYGGDE